MEEQWPDDDHEHYLRAQRRAVVRGALITGVVVGSLTAVLAGFVGGGGGWLPGLVVGVFSGIASWLYLRSKVG